MRHAQQSIGRDKAIEMAESLWWVGQPQHELVKFQLFTAELAMPFNIFHEALENTLARPVFTHEIGLNFDGIVQEFLGEKEPPTFQEIMALIPEEKQFIVTI